MQITTLSLTSDRGHRCFIWCFLPHFIKYLLSFICWGLWVGWGKGAGGWEWEEGVLISYQKNSHAFPPGAKFERGPECPLGRRVNHYTTGAAVKTEEGDTTWSYFRNLRLAAVCRWRAVSLSGPPSRYTPRWSRGHTPRHTRWICNEVIIVIVIIITIITPSANRMHKSRNTFYKCYLLL